MRKIGSFSDKVMLRDVARESLSVSPGHFRQDFTPASKIGSYSDKVMLRDVAFHMTFPPGFHACEKMGVFVTE